MNDFTCNKKYVIGAYVPYLMKYYYWGSHDYVSNLQDAKSYDSPTEAERFIKERLLADISKYGKPYQNVRKGIRFSVSKVFEKPHRSIFSTTWNTKLTLTNPNHYEKLCAVVNEI